MTDIVKKPNVQATEWDPFRTMRELLRWDPFREMTPMYGAFERTTFNPSFDVTETKDAYVFKADLPGVRPEEIEISTTGNRLQISGKRESEQESKSETVYTWEREYGSFARSFTLPDSADVEHAKSKLEAGVLTLVIPKKSWAEAKKISISTSTTKS